MIGWTVCEGKDEGEVWQERGLVRECERGVSWKKGHQCRVFEGQGRTRRG